MSRTPATKPAPKIQRKKGDNAPIFTMSTPPVNPIHPALVKPLNNLPPLERMIQSPSQVHYPALSTESQDDGMDLDQAPTQDPPVPDPSPPSLAKTLLDLRRWFMGRKGGIYHLDPESPIPDTRQVDAFLSAKKNRSVNLSNASRVEFVSASLSSSLRLKETMERLVLGAFEAGLDTSGQQEALKTTCQQQKENLKSFFDIMQPGDLSKYDTMLKEYLENSRRLAAPVVLPTLTMETLLMLALRIRVDCDLLAYFHELKRLLDMVPTDLSVISFSLLQTGSPLLLQGGHADLASLYSLCQHCGHWLIERQDQAVLAVCALEGPTCLQCVLEHDRSLLQPWYSVIQPTVDTFQRRLESTRGEPDAWLSLLVPFVQSILE